MISCSSSTAAGFRGTRVIELEHKSQDNLSLGQGGLCICVSSSSSRSDLSDSVVARRCWEFFLLLLFLKS